mgnify:FL=1
MIKLPKMLRILPERPYGRPRDGKNLKKTEDFLFQAMLVSETKGKYIVELDTRDYAPEDYPSSSKPIAKFKRKTVLKWFTDSFYCYRSTLFRARKAGYRFFIHNRGKAKEAAFEMLGSIFTDDEGLDIGQLATFARELRWPFDEEHDPLLSDISRIPLLAWEEAPLSSDQLYCPLDGPVKPIVSWLSSPVRTWRALAGREWQFLLCPKCVGALEHHLTQMN